MNTKPHPKPLSVFHIAKLLIRSSATNYESLTALFEKATELYKDFSTSEFNDPLRLEFVSINEFMDDLSQTKL